MTIVFFPLVLLYLLFTQAGALVVVIAGGTGPLGKELMPMLQDHQVTVLCRNAFLAATPSRVTKDFGWVGAKFLQKNPHVKLRDWDGGDLLDIVGQDWVGWQEDTLKDADVVLHLVGGYTEQRYMACERLVRESLTYQSKAKHITVNPVDDDVPPPKGFKLERIRQCEDLVSQNCATYECLRVEGYRLPAVCAAILKALE